MKRNEIHLHWRRAVESIQSSQMLFTAGHYYNCVSRAYYANLHAARAVFWCSTLFPKVTTLSSVYSVNI
ncbi:MAG: HEPN domain-containing protein [Candidatus Omnitrophota bacterium]|nr:MAG: HEPN domain-containing protein [Candidatus Omnitrophota bacterium]